jgi:hypothetical protein
VRCGQSYVRYTATKSMRASRQPIPLNGRFRAILALSPTTEIPATLPERAAKVPSEQRLRGTWSRE